MASSFKCPKCESANTYARQDGMQVCRKCGNVFSPEKEEKKK